MIVGKVFDSEERARGYYEGLLYVDSIRISNVQVCLASDGFRWIVSYQDHDAKDVTATHTPGPWMISVHGDGGLIVAENDPDAGLCQVYGTCQEEYACNAHLIAAAPELFEACQAVLDNWESGDLAAAARQCYRALSKAKGGAK